MEKNLISRLNQINRDFYKNVAHSFHNTRQQEWVGWEVLLPQLQTMTRGDTAASILDLGCGNARFAKFFSEKIKPNFEYTGLDTSEELLKEASKTTTALEISVQFMNLDMVTALLDETFLGHFNQLKYDLVVSFGVLHHIPSFELRVSYLNQLLNLLKPGGVVVISLWQFANFDRFSKKAIAPSQVGIDERKLEDGDYFLGWDSQGSSTRYCHSFSDPEIEKIISVGHFQVIKQFKADGKEQQLNTYLVLQPKAQ